MEFSIGTWKAACSRCKSFSSVQEEHRCRGELLTRIPPLHLIRVRQRLEVSGLQESAHHSAVHDATGGLESVIVLGK
jgi:hypothetical protein